MSNWKISRRHFISSSGTMLLLPLLEGFVPSIARAAGTADPKRFVGMYMPNGTWNRPGDQVWYPPTGALTTDLPPVLSPFSDNRSDFSVVKNIAMTARD